MTWLVGFAHPYEAEWAINHGGRVKAINGEPVKDWRAGAVLTGWLKQAGEEGWELVGFQHPRGGHGVAAGENADAVYVFKRPKTDAATKVR